MKTLISLIAVLSLAGADLAAARVRTVMKTGNGGGVQALARVSYKTTTPKAATPQGAAPKAKAGVRKASARSKVRRKARRAAPKAVLAARRTTPAAKAAPKRTLALRDDTPTGAPDHPGWFKAPGKAGYGVSKGGTETMVGLYTRPQRPDIPGPQMYEREGRGAAGVSLSLKLGH